MLALPVASEHPIILASIGLGAVHKAGKGFDYKKLAVAQDVSGTPPAIVESLDVVDDDESINSFPPIIWSPCPTSTSTRCRSPIGIGGSSSPGASTPSEAPLPPRKRHREDKREILPLAA